MKSIDLKILFHTQGTLELEELGIQTEDLGEFKIMTFYTINAIAEYFTDNTRSIIYCNGTTFICALSYKQLKEVLQTW